MVTLIRWRDLYTLARLEGNGVIDSMIWAFVMKRKSPEERQSEFNSIRANQMKRQYLREFDQDKLKKIMKERDEELRKKYLS